LALLLTSGKSSFGYGANVHNHLQRQMSKCFPLFKRCEWLVSNWYVSK